jgi:hypothetical protein
MPTDAYAPESAVMRAHCGEPALGIAARGELDAHRMTLGVQAQRLLAREGELDGTLRHPREERGLRLDAHVLLAAEGAAVGHQLDEHLLVVDPEHARHLPAIVEHPLALRGEVDAALGGRGERALGLEEQVLDPLRPPHALDDVLARGERRRRVPAAEDRSRQEVLVRGIHARRAGRQRLLDAQHRRQHLVLDLDPRRRGAGRDLAVGGDRGEDVPHAAHLLAHGHEGRPVLVDEAVPPLPRHVGRGHHGRHAGVRERGLGADRAHAGARVRGQREGAEEQARGRQVVDEGPRPEGERARLVHLEPGADAAVDHRPRQRLAPARARHRLDRVQDAPVAGAATQVLAECRGDLHAARLRPGPEQVPGADHEAGRAVPALDGVVRGERVRELLARLGRQALERDDVAALRGGPGDRARGMRLAIDERRAGAALALRRTTTLERGEPERVAQQIEQGLPLERLGLARRSVHRETHRHHALLARRAGPPGHRARSRRAHPRATSTPG